MDIGGPESEIDESMVLEEDENWVSSRDSPSSAIEGLMNEEPVSVQLISGVVSVCVMSELGIGLVLRM